MIGIIIGILLAIAGIYCIFIHSGNLSREEEKAERTQKKGVDRYV